MNNLKSVFNKLVGHLGGGPGHSPFSSDVTDSSELEHELLVVTKASEMNRSSFQDGFPPPSPPCTPVERMETPELDEVLFSKNNVFLSYPKRASLKTQELTTFSSNERKRSPSPLSSPTTTSDNSNSNSSASGSFQDNQILVPGYLFITTRGSNYGTTLILNWAPNSSMRVPPLSLSSTSLPLHLQPSTSTNSLGSTTISTVTNSDQIGTAGISIGDKERDPVVKERIHITKYTEGDTIVVTTNSGESPLNSWPIVTATGRRGDALAAVTGRVEKVGAGVGLSRAGVCDEEGLLGYDRPSCSSVSIDLGMMEMIRIFYNTDMNGFIVSGEMVIRSKDRNFKVSKPISTTH